MINTIQEKLEEILGGLPSDTLDEIYEELHEVLCKSIIVLLQDSIAGPGISQQQIDSARGVAEECLKQKQPKNYLNSWIVKRYSKPL